MRIDHHANAVYIHVHNYILGLSQKWIGSVKFKEGEAFYPIAYIASFKSQRQIKVLTTLVTLIYLTHTCHVMKVKLELHEQQSWGFKIYKERLI